MVSIELQVAKLQARVDELEAMLGQNDNRIAIAYGLPPRMSNLLGLLLTVEVATPEMIQDQLGIATNTKVAIHRLRTYMALHDVTIHSQRGLGYWLDEETKQRLTERVTNGG
jgi:DNA-binding response OmpR family regulator